MKCPSGLLLSAFFLSAVSAQNMIGVTFTGQVLRIQSTTGATTVLASGQIGKNCLCCTTDNRLITTVRTGTPVIGFHWHLAQIDAFTGAETLLFGTADVGDLRAMAPGTPGSLFAIRDASPSDQLVRIDLATGVVTLLGSTGFAGIQALDTTGAGMRAWDAAAGVLLISSQTGVATDPFPGIGGPAGIQWMATNPETNATFVGGAAMHQLAVTTGVTSSTLSISGNPDLRGVEFTTSRQQLIGQGCAAAQGLANAAAQGPFGNGQSLEVHSLHHAPAAFCVQILGFSETVHAGQPLPIDLDPLLGTSNCRLRVSIDVTSFSGADQTGRAIFTTPLPPGFAFFQIYAQVAAFDPVPGGTSWSNGLRLRPTL